MAEIEVTIEALEHRFMRAWMRPDACELRKLVRRDFMMIVGAERSQLLDRPSFLEAAEARLRCNSYRFREVIIRRHGPCAWFAAGVDLEMRIGGRDWEGHFWLTDLWRKGKMPRAWKLAERSLSRTDPDKELPAAIQHLQLWN